MKKFLLSLATMLCVCAFASAETVTFTFYSTSQTPAYNNYGLEPAYTDSNTKYIANGSSTAQDGITLTLSGASADSWRNWSDGLRAYGGKTPTLQITGADGATITGVSFELKDAITITASTGTMGKTTSVKSNSWTGSTDDVTFTLTGKTRALQVLTITYEAAIAGGPANAGLSFASSALEVGIGETVDGPALTKATTAEAVYSSSNDAVATVDAATGKVTGVAAGTATITAKTAATADFKEGTASYTVTVVDYSIPGMTIENPMTVAQALAACTADKQTVYVQGIVTVVTTPYSTQYNNVTYNIVDDGSNDVLVVFRGKWGAGVTPTADKNPEVGARVIVHGDILIYTDSKTGAQTKEVNTGNEIVSYEAPGSFDGVEDIVADDANAPVEYYNLQGVRVANPENGLYIRVQGKKATKVLVR